MFTLTRTPKFSIRGFFYRATIGREFVFSADTKAEATDGAHKALENAIRYLHSETYVRVLIDGAVMSARQVGDDSILSEIHRTGGGQRVSSSSVGTMSNGREKFRSAKDFLDWHADHYNEAVAA